MTDGAEIPGPSWPRWYAAARYGADPLNLYSRLAQRHGDLFRIAFPGFPPLVVVADPERAGQVFMDHDTFQAGEPNRLIFGPLDGRRSVVTVDGEHHRELRRALGPVASWGRRNQSLVDEVFETEIGRWPVNRVFSVRRRIHTAVLDLILRMTVGVSSTEDPELAAAVRRTALRARPLLSAPALRRNLGPASPWQRFLRSRRALDDRLARYLQEPGGPDCAAAELLGGGVSAENPSLRDSIVSLLMAGYETSSTAIAWTFERVAAHPEAADRARDGEPDYLDAVAREALRLRAPFPQVWRMASGPARLGEHEVPAGHIVAVAIGAIHTRPDVFEDPSNFRPERHLGRSPAGWMPFGGGVRACLGASLARQMSAAALSAALDRGRLERSGRDERPLLWGGTVVPLRGGRVVLRAD